MDSTFSQNRWLPPAWLRFLVVILLALGIFCRCVNLDLKEYWNDEVYTSIRVSGYTEAELLKEISEPQAIPIKEFQNKYQSPNPEKGVTGTIRGLALEEPQLTPLYFIFARFWAQVFGSSVAAMRSLPVFLSLLSFPCIYWLCLELFESSLIGWMAVALFAISPYFVLYAQEGRPYSLWTLIILLSSVLLLRVLRIKNTASWVCYTVTLIAAFYTHLFSLPIAMGQGLYVVLIERFRLSKTLIAYLISSLLSILAFSPWLLVIVGNRSGIDNGTGWQSSTKISLIELLRGLIRHPSRAFLDLNPTPQDPGIYRISLMVLTFILLVFVGYSFYFLCRNTAKSIWLFIIILSGCVTVPLLAHDLIFGGFLSNLGKYILPSYLGFIIAAAYLFAVKLTSIFSNKLQQKLWQLITIGIISLSVLSSTVFSQAESWWSKGDPDKQQDMIEAAQIINKASNPLVISDDYVDTILVLSYLFAPKVKLLPIANRCGYCDQRKPQAESELKIVKIPDGFSDIFIYPYPSERLLSVLKKESNAQLEPTYKLRKSILWRLEKTTNQPGTTKF